jgi:signal transduction histidine kinase
VSYELQRQQATEKLARQNERLERFASVVSHDLRNPLSVLKGRLTLAEETGDAAEFRRCYDALERMNDLIDDLLAVARADTVIGEPEPISLGPLVERCWQTVSTPKATLRVETDRTVDADESRLRQLFENLIRNAVEHGGKTVTVTVGDLPDGFFVEDDGPGIDEDDREAVFETGVSTSSGGTGFGLAIVQEIADAHGWDVRITEADDGGARFEFTGVERQ